jgi:hypothetical protein
MGKFRTGLLLGSLLIGCDLQPSPSDGGMLPGPGPGPGPRPDGMMGPPPDGGMMGPPPDGGMMMGPRTCTMQSDCAMACPPGSLGCKCVAPPMGMGMSMICVPTCTMDTDCPMPPMGSLRCDTMQGVCVPRMM